MTTVTWRYEATSVDPCHVLAIWADFKHIARFSPCPSWLGLESKRWMPVVNGVGGVIRFCTDPCDLVFSSHLYLSLVANRDRLCSFPWLWVWQPLATCLSSFVWEPYSPHARVYLSVGEDRGISYHCSTCLFSHNILLAVYKAASARPLD